MEKIIVCEAQEAIKEIQPLLDDGWTIKICVSESTPLSSGEKGHFVDEKTKKKYAFLPVDIVFILEKKV